MGMGGSGVLGGLGFWMKIDAINEDDHKKNLKSKN